MKLINDGTNVVEVKRMIIKPKHNIITLESGFSSDHAIAKIVSEGEHKDKLVLIHPGLIRNIKDVGVNMSYVLLHDAICFVEMDEGEELIEHETVKLPPKEGSTWTKIV